MLHLYEAYSMCDYISFPIDHCDISVKHLELVTKRMFYSVTSMALFLDISVVYTRRVRVFFGYIYSSPRRESIYPIKHELEFYKRLLELQHPEIVIILGKT